MRAVTVIEGDRLEVVERDVPAPEPDQVLVRVHGAGVNRADLLQRAGLYPAPPGSPVDIPGMEFAGVVEAVGAEVDDAFNGATVFGIVGGGAQADYLTTKAAHCAFVPAGLDLVAMGGVPEAFITAHDAMVTQAHLVAREWVLVHAVGSGVGTAAMQLAEAFRARTVGTARSASKLERCAGLGLDVGIVPPRRDDGTLDVDLLASQIVDATGGGADVTVDLVGGAYVEADIAAAAPKGRIMLIGALAGGTATLGILGVMGKRLSVVGTMLRSRSAAEKSDATRAFERDVVPLLEREVIAPVVDSVLPIEKASDAYDLVASDATFGKVILDCR
ncbi:MAG: NADPH:quinone reductase [Actinomycetota bacterium]|nr:NADPH:quinone reductase [Actinomycetota bacterium]